MEHHSLPTQENVAARNTSGNVADTARETAGAGVNKLSLELGPQDAATKKALAGKEPSELNKTIVEARLALKNIDSAAGTLNKMLGESKGPVKNFTETGLNELSMTIRELRQLTANLNVIATRLERDPSGFVFSGKQGYTPK